MLYKLKEIFCYKNSADHVLWNRVFQNIFGIKCRKLLPNDDWFAKIIFNILPMSCNLFWITIGGCIWVLFFFLFLIVLGVGGGGFGKGEGRVVLWLLQWIGPMCSALNVMWLSNVSALS